MQQLNVYSIHDQAADAFITPFFMPNDEVAKRTFYQCVQDPNHQFHLSPTDFCLFKIGEFNVTSGALEPLNQPKSLGLAIAFLKPRGTTSTPTPSPSEQNNQIDIED